MDHPDERSSHVEGHEASFFAFDLGSKFYFRDIFNSYVFVRLQEADRNRVFNIPGVVRFVFCLGKAARVQESEIQLMKEYLDGESLEDARIEQFAVGEEVTFTRGARKTVPPL